MIQLNLIPYQILGFILQKYFPDKKIGGGKCASGGACHVRGLVVSGGATRYFVVVALSSSVYTVANQRNNFSNKYGSNFI